MSPIISSAGALIFFKHPIHLLFIIPAALSLGVPIIKPLLKSRKPEQAGPTARPPMAGR